MKKNECERVMKIKACEIWATSIDADKSQHCTRGEKAEERAGKRTEVDDHVQTRVVVVLERVDAELALEEGGEDDGAEEGDGAGSEEETVRESEGEDLAEVPRVRSRRRQDAVEREGHDGTVVEERNDQNHERREVELEGKGHDGETDDCPRQKRRKISDPRSKFHR